jgi:hypothetical protein
MVNTHYPHGHHIPHAHDVVRALDVPIRQLADVYQAGILEPNVDECTEVHDVEDSSFELHARAQVLQLENPLLENRLGKVVARVALRARQRFDHVTQGELANVQLAGQPELFGFGKASAELLGTTLVAHHLGLETKPFEKFSRSRVTFGVDPGPVERVGAIGNLEKARSLREGRWADSLDLHQLVTSREGTVLLAVVDDAPGRQLIETGDVPQKGSTRRIQIDAYEVDATGNDRFQCFLELLRVYVVLIESYANVLRLDLDQLGQRILEPAADRNPAAERCVAFGQLFAAHLAGGIDARAGLVDDDISKLLKQGICRVGLGRFLDRWG